MKPKRAAQAAQPMHRYRSHNQTYHNPQGERLVYLSYPRFMFQTLVYTPAERLRFNRIYNADEAVLAQLERDTLIAAGGFTPEPPTKVRG